MKLADKILVATLTTLATAAWCITAIVTWQGNPVADLIAAGIAALLTFIAYASWRGAHGT